MSNLLTGNNYPLRLSAQKFSLLFTLLYALLLAYLLPFHELWVDETEPWLLALHIHSYSDLVYNKRFEGHPNLWYSLLYFVTRFTDNLAALKISHFSFSVGFVFVFLRYAPFHWLIRLLFCFGYYGIFEYGIISRLYAPELLFTFLICTLYPKRFTHWYFYIALLALNAHTHVFGLMFSGLLGILLLSEALGLDKNIPEVKNVPVIKRLTGLAFLALAGILSIWSVIRPGEFDSTPYLHYYYALQTLTRISQAFFPIPEFSIHFWNTSFLRSRYTIPMAILIIGVLSYILRENKKLLIVFLSSTFLLFLFFYLKYEGSLRHHAHFFIFTLAIFWINSHSINYSSSFRLSSTNLKQMGLLNWLLLIATSVQFMVGIYAVGMDMKYSFYPGKAQAAYIEEHYPDHLLATTEEFPSSTVSAYLGKPIFYFFRGKYVTFYEVNPTVAEKLTFYQNLQWAKKWAQENKKPVLLISPRVIAIEHFPYPVKFIKSFDRNQIVVRPEHRSQYFYLIEPGYFPVWDYVAGNVVTAPLSPVP